MNQICTITIPAEIGHGLMPFNEEVRFHNTGNGGSILRARINALSTLYKDKHKGLFELCEALRELYPHWFGTDRCTEQKPSEAYEECLKVLQMLGRGEPSMPVLAVNYHRELSDKVIASVNVKMRKTAAVPRSQRPRKKYARRAESCRAHPDRIPVVHDLCQTCYQRVRKIEKMSLLTSDTPAILVDKVLNMPSMKGRFKFQRAIKEIFQRGIKEIFGEED